MSGNSVYLVGFKQETSMKQAFEACLVLVSCMAYCSALKMGAACSPETLAGFQQTTWHYIPEDSTLQVTLLNRC
jgi:hypothetical protein